MTDTPPLQIQRNKSTPFYSLSLCFSLLSLLSLSQLHRPNPEAQHSHFQTKDNPNNVPISLAQSTCLNNPTPSSMEFQDASAPPIEFRFRTSNDVPDSSDPTLSDSPVTVGAKYKLFPPAKLPISRSPCITIPPGLSPSSFLESPVLLSNMMKAEPSPTTGSFIKPQTIHASVGSATHLVDTLYSNNNALDERKPSCFEFRPHSRSNMAPVDNHEKYEQSMQVQGWCQTQPFAPSSIKSEVVISSSGNLAAPVRRFTSEVGVPAQVDTERAHPTTGTQTLQTDSKGTGPSVASERLAEDGYNWRKYGQKHVKGSEFPRSYYKCTHPTCEVKKLFERSYDGRITEIIYKGTHDHPKPQPSRRYSGGTVISGQEERADKSSSLSGRDDKSNIYGHSLHMTDPNGTPEESPVRANDENVEDAGSHSNRTRDEADDDDPLLKRRKMEFGGLDITPVVKPTREPRVVVQTLSEVDILDDGYRWRKYGQKVVRGNPNPRSYYKCTNAGCPVRKHVERASHDPKAVITTYEGKHNHDVPSTKTSTHDMAGPLAVCGASRIKSEETNSVSLDLGVGINSVTENRSSDQQQMLLYELVQKQPNPKVVESSQVSSYYGLVNAGMNQYGSKDNQNDDRSVQVPPLNHSSYPYPQNAGRILTGP